MLESCTLLRGSHPCVTTAWFVVYKAGRPGAFRAGRGVALDCRAGSRNRRARQQHVELRPRQTVEHSVRDCRREQRVVEWEVAQPAILYFARIKSAAQPALERSVAQTAMRKGPGIAHVAHASNHGNPRNLWISVFPQRKNMLRRVQHHGRLPAKYLRVSGPPCVQGVQGLGPRCARLLLWRLWYAATPRSRGSEGAG